MLTVSYFMLVCIPICFIKPFFWVQMGKSDSPNYVNQIEAATPVTAHIILRVKTLDPQPEKLF